LRGYAPADALEWNRPVKNPSTKAAHDGRSRRGRTQGDESPAFPGTAISCTPVIMNGVRRKKSAFPKPDKQTLR
jgi:hypothetical protein